MKGVHERLTQVKDAAVAVCTSRNYTFDAADQRNLIANVGDGVCTDGTAVARSWSNDKADRVLNAGTGQGSYVYDALGRQTLVPVGDVPGGSDIEIAYFDDDLARSIATGGTSTTFDLDALAHRSVTTTTGGDASVVTRVYSDSSDNPTAAREMSDGVTRTSSYAGAIAGDVLYTQVDSDGATLTSVGIADPIGSVVATHALSDVGGTRTALPGSGSGLAVYDEYGNRAGTGVQAGALDYGWLGGKERASDASGLVLMGVRLFNSATGLFTSVDPVVGGNESVYGYPSGPINKLDLDGRKSWWARNWKWVAAGVAVAVVVGVCVAATAACVSVATATVRGVRTLASVRRPFIGKKVDGVRHTVVGVHYRSARYGSSRVLKLDRPGHGKDHWHVVRAKVKPKTGKHVALNSWKVSRSRR